MRSLVHGVATLEAAGCFGMPVAIDASFAWLIDNFAAGLERTTPLADGMRRGNTATG